MDDFDHASIVEERYRELAIAAATRAIPLEPPASEQFCQNEACGIEIPEARREAAPGCRFCVECQERRENAIRRRFQCR